MQIRTKEHTQQEFYGEIINTETGLMVAIANNENLLSLKFISQLDTENLASDSRIKFETNHILKNLTNELHAYFKGKNSIFETPILQKGTLFQQKVWHALRKIPFGETISYQELASSINHPLAHRAVGNANSKNAIAIVIPCHRVIHANGRSGGYAGGRFIKKWLLQHESH